MMRKLAGKMLNQIMDELTERRMMSVGNLTTHFEMEPEELQPRLDQLEAGGRIRFAFTRCSGSCSSDGTTRKRAKLHWQSPQPL